MIDTSLLNSNQEEAVLDDNQYLRIVAGAGSGKTRVLTMRIAHLILDKNVFPNKILAITFTNKAANEMKERIGKMLGEEVGQPWISTIHSLCVRILREDIACMGYPQNFTIIDAEDQKKILKEAYKQFDIDSNTFSYPSMLSYISNNKCADIDVSRAYKIAGELDGEKIKAQVYEFYEQRQRGQYALDFDDLVLWVVRMFRRFDEVRQKWQKRFQYIHVDEFQDIDKLQYELIRLLTGTSNDLYVVGDPDQTIYTWRGADVNIIMNFKKDFPDAKTITLNENYRSTNAILNGANSVIRNNRNRLEKDLYTNRKSDEKITHYSSASNEYEAAWIASEIQRLHQAGKEYHDIAVLYRSNYLSRALEKALLDQRIPYIIYGGVRFYERMEVKDALSYLRLAVVGDDFSFMRIINSPKRGIGDKTLDTILEKARETHQSMYETVKNEDLFSGKVKVTLANFVQMVERWKNEIAKGDKEIFQIFEMIMNESGYKEYLESLNEPDRLENLKSVIDDIKEFSDTYFDSSIDEYLQQVTLYGNREETMNGDYIQLMTVHAAKGLEFDTVFVSDMNEGIFPNDRAMKDGSHGIEEERRLAYVAFTRAKNKLYLTDAGGFNYVLQANMHTSRFVNEIDDEYIEHVEIRQRDEENIFAGRSTLFKEQKESYRTDKVFLDISDNAGEKQERIRKKEAGSYKTGEKVIHAKFGEGVVIACKDGFVQIAFAYPHGVKKIAAGHPSLKKKSELS